MPSIGKCAADCGAHVGNWPTVTVIESVTEFPDESDSLTLKTYLPAAARLHGSRRIALVVNCGAEAPVGKEDVVHASVVLSASVLLN